jgi:hypothetical protein
MPKYCSHCLSEFREKVEKCPKDGTALTDKKPKAFERLVDFYAASDEMEAEHIVAMLRGEGVVTAVSFSGVSQLPAMSDRRFFVVVLKDDVKKARFLVEQARKDEVISKQGSFI